MKIYIAGPITNIENYKENFQKAHDELIKNNHIVLNPAILPAGLTQEEYMRICIPMLNICEAIYLLKGWENSVGAKIEYALAKQAKKLLIYQ